MTPLVAPSSRPHISYSSMQMLRDLWKHLRAYRWMFLFASAMRALGDIVWLYPAFAFATIVSFFTHYQPGASLRPIWIALALWMLCNVVRAIGQYCSKNYGYRIAERVDIDTILSATQHLFRLDIGWHEKENSGNKIQRINKASDGFNRIIRLWLNSTIEVIVNLIAINFIIAGFDRWVLSAIIFFLITYFLFSRFMVKHAGVASYRVNQQEEHVNGLLFEAINNIRTVKVMALGSSFFQIISKGTDELFGRYRRRIFFYQTRGAVLGFWANGFRIGITLMIILGMIHGRYDIGFLILFSTYFGNLRESIDELSNSMEDFVTAKYSVARLQEILKEPITIDNEEGKIGFPKTWHTIRFDHVSFSYGDHDVLRDVSLEIKRGQKIGIVGLSGAGKSTMFKLLLKERENFTGDVLFDDLSIKRIRSKDYFKEVSVVLQDTEVFNLSLRDNIVMTNARQKSNHRLFTSALKTAHINEFLSKLPHGVETLIGEKGIKLSGGERQRLGIARAIFKQPQILLLDEATSHLDSESEEKIRDSLDAFFKNVTAVVIAHRLSTIKAMDKIIVVEKGRVIETGTFEELLAKEGRFYELWRKQEL